jgi:hypothetical protein
VEDQHDAPPGHTGDDPTNPRYFGLPLGVIAAALIALVSMAAVMAKFYPS